MYDMLILLVVTIYHRSCMLLSFFLFYSC